MKGLNIAFKILLGVALLVTALRALTYYPRAFDTDWQAALLETAGVASFILVLVVGVRWTDRRLNIRWCNW